MPTAVFLVLHLGIHKTSRATSRSRLLLPVVIPIFDVRGEMWVENALRALESVGMQVRGDIDGPLLRAPASADSKELSAREVRSAEITAF